MGKSKVIPVRIDDKTHQLIERAAFITGQTVSGYIRHAAQVAAERDAGSITAASRRPLPSRISRQIDLPIRDKEK